jgi:hypothetical protein
MDTIIADKIVYLDCGMNLISDEDILEFSNFANMPIETERITLDNFKDVLMSLFAANKTM